MSLALQIRVSAPNTARPARKTHGPGSLQGPGVRGFTGLLLEGVQERVAAARGHLLAGNDAERDAILQSALMLLDELRTDVDLFNGGAVAANLDDLYDYMGRRLGAADLQNGIAALDEVSYLLEALHSAWAFLPAEALSASRN